MAAIDLSLDLDGVTEKDVLVPNMDVSKLDQHLLLENGDIFSKNKLAGEGCRRKEQTNSAKGGDSQAFCRNLLTNVIKTVFVPNGNRTQDVADVITRRDQQIHLASGTGIIALEKTETVKAVTGGLHPKDGHCIADQDIAPEFRSLEPQMGNLLYSQDSPSNALYSQATMSQAIHFSPHERYSISFCKERDCEDKMIDLVELQPYKECQKCEHQKCFQSDPSPDGYTEVHYDGYTFIDVGDFQTPFKVTTPVSAEKSFRRDTLLLNANSGIAAELQSVNSASYQSDDRFSIVSQDQVPRYDANIGGKQCWAPTVFDLPLSLARVNAAHVSNIPEETPKIGPAAQEGYFASKLLAFNCMGSQLPTNDDAGLKPESLSFSMLCGEPSDMLPPTRLPPDYLKIGMLLLLPACPFAIPALWWGYRSRTHCKNGELVRAWQHSHRAFCCSMTGLVFLVVLLFMFSIAMYFHDNPCPRPLPIIQSHGFIVTTKPPLPHGGLSLNWLSGDHTWTSISTKIAKDNFLHELLNPAMMESSGNQESSGDQEESLRTFDDNEAVS